MNLRDPVMLLRRIFPVVAAVLLASSLSACRSQTKTPLRVFVAGSLVIPFEQLKQAYEKLHPDVDVQVEAHGSIQVIRHVTEIHDQIDVVVPADYSLIPMLMYTSTNPENGEPYAGWYIKFASNRLVLAYTPLSKSSGEINADNWHRIISQPEVKLGLSDPRFDAAGYRSLMILQLAEEIYGDPTIFERVVLGRFKEPITVEKSANQHIIHVPELLETTEKSNILMRGGSVALLALLESGEIDYTFEYESVARQHGLKFVELPPRLNLGDLTLDDEYHHVQVQLDYQRFSSVKPEFDGKLIGYGVTIPTNAPHPGIAEDFVTFLLSPDGTDIMESNYHPVFEFPEVDNCPVLPAYLRLLCELRE